MKTILTGDHAPIKLWTDESSVEARALEQLKNSARLPAVFKHLAVMPDVHLGIGATIGSVIAMRDSVCPAAVGVDIGCGVMAVKTSLRAEDVAPKSQQLRSAIESVIPVGFSSQREVLEQARRQPFWKTWDRLSFVDGKLREKALLQLGTLGSGNHFIEVCQDLDQSVWVMLHSGSRNVGKTLAERHIAEAKSVARLANLKLPDPNLAYFTQSTPEFKNYLHDVNWCQNYASVNRALMMDGILTGLAEVMNLSTPLRRQVEINCHHNYVEREVHFGEKVLVTRKGAVRAREGEFGIIPGSMGTRSFVIRGKGNPESFHSCSHGAGRRMSRNEAKRRFTTRDLVEATQGVECRKDRGVLDESPGAYKDIDEVMRNQTDLVEIVAELKQFLCVKG